MSQFFISCKESRIETNRSFYGCFYLGPFEPSQSLTLANALRRTLLSELYGLGIVSVEIEGATHEYSSLPGVRDSVLDILLNLKEIVLKKTIKNFKPQIGYLRVRGPGVVRASDLRLPPFIQCVDPNQYIATLADNGFLNLKFIIQYGNKWLSSKNSLDPNASSYNKSVSFINSSNELNKSQPIPTKGRDNSFNNHLKKRRLILKKLKHISFGMSQLKNKTSSNNTFTMSLGKRSEQSNLFLSKYAKKNLTFGKRKKLSLTIPLSKKYPAINLKNGCFKRLNQSLEKDLLDKNELGQTNLNSVNNKKIYNRTNINFQNKLENNSSLTKKMVFFNSNPLTIDAIFNPINKVNYIIEINDFKMAPSKIQTSIETSELYEMLKTTKSASDFLTTNDVEQSFKNYMENQGMTEKQNISLLNQFPNSLALSDIENILEIKREINALKRDTIQHNITLEIWTNGSIHPRDALYQAFKNLMQLFAKLKKINSFGINDFSLNSLSAINTTKIINEKNIEGKIGFSTKKLSKKIKMGEITSTLLQDLLPLNETSFLSTYVAPRLKNYYLNDNNLSNLLEISSKNAKTQTSSSLNQNNSLFNKDLSSNIRLPLDKSSQTKGSEINAEIGILNLSLRSYTSLKRLKVNTLTELFELINKDFTSFKQLGKTTVEEIEQSLTRIGFSVKKD